MDTAGDCKVLKISFRICTLYVLEYDITGLSQYQFPTLQVCLTVLDLSLISPLNPLTRYVILF